MGSKRILRYAWIVDFGGSGVLEPIFEGSRKAEADLARGGFAEYYLLTFVRTRVEVLQGITGNDGLAANFSADWIWQPYADWTLTLGPRLQLANSIYASDYFSTQNAYKTGFYVPFRAEGGLLSSGAEVNGNTI